LQSDALTAAAANGGGSGDYFGLRSVAGSQTLSLPPTNTEAGSHHKIHIKKFVASVATHVVNFIGNVSVKTS